MLVRISLLALLMLQSLPFTSEKRTEWSYVPGRRPGVAIGNMTTQQRADLEAMLQRTMSPQGIAKAKGVIELEPILGQIEGSSFRDPARYFHATFGDPSSNRWGWKFEGHHLSLNFTHAGGEVSATPAFIGANPARVPSGPRKGWRLLATEEDLGRELLRSLSTSQRLEAVISIRAPSDIVTGTERQISLQKYEGLRGSKMTTLQRELMMKLVKAYVGNAAPSIAQRELALIKREELYFAWAGGSEPGQPHYYRIHGPTILIEYDNTQNGANHIHSVWRAPGRDFGEDLLAKHYAEAH